MLNNILINKLNNRGVILNNPRPKTPLGTKKWCRKRGKALNNKHQALNNRLNNILNNKPNGLINALNNILINRAPRLFNMKQLRGFVAQNRHRLSQTCQNYSSTGRNSLSFQLLPGSL